MQHTDGVSAVRGLTAAFKMNGIYIHLLDYIIE